jgi:hypothetical protein
MKWQAEGEFGDPLSEEYWSPAYKEFMGKTKEAIARAEAALSSSDDTPPSAEERRLRRMLCLRCHGTAAYMDDGEASFGGDEFQRPTDYLRESLDSIQQAWVDAVMKEAASVLGDGKPFMRGCELRDDAVGVFKP